MIAPQFGWILCILTLAVLGISSWWRSGTSRAIGLMVTSSFALPVWLEMDFFGFPFNIQTSTALLSMVLLIFMDPWRIWSRIVALDVVMAGIFSLHVASDVYHGWPIIPAGMFAYGEWVLPYVAGRFAIRHWEDADELAKWISNLVLVIGLLGVVEAITHVNAWELIFGSDPVDVASRNIHRMGFKRAFGPTLHPIFFGLLLLCLAPWPLTAINWAQTFPHKCLAVASLIMAVAGTVASISRGPILGLFLLAVTYFSFRSLKVRLCSIIALIVVVIWFAIDINGAVQFAESTIGQNRRELAIQFEGKNIELSTTKMRLTQLQVMLPAFMESGFLGYGTKATSTLPPDVPHLPKDKKTREILKWVDNAYLMYGLRFGWTGVGLFILLLICAFRTGVMIAGDRSNGVLGAALASMIAAFAAALWTVWLSYDCGFELLWSLGILGGLLVQKSQSRV